ncbi:MAG TPA: NAD-dependent epimerase/dehydratase family protein [Bdellovibrionales bacterium]|nr:NAD-dependent epimerase/dehydratase family protein [Bdellovibrionales bacterium]
MKVLVTGATGFLGGWLVRRLLDEGHDVRIIKRPNSSLEELTGLKLDIVPGDVTDRESLVAASRGVDTVFHLAGLIGYSRAQRNAMELINVGGTKNVIEACEINSVRKLVYLSSVVAIGASFDKTPLNEDSPYNVSHLHLGYFDTKHDAETLVRAACENKRIDAVMVNPSTIYGPADAKKGSRGAQLKVARGKLPFYPPGGVSIVSVEDVVDSIIAVWNKGRTGERYIVSGENLLLKDVFDIIADQAGVKPPSIALPRPALFALGKIGDVMESFGKKGPLNTENAWTSTLYHWFDSAKAQRELGLKLKPAEYAISQSVRWMRDNGYL